MLLPPPPFPFFFVLYGINNPYVIVTAVFIRVHEFCSGAIVIGMCLNREKKKLNVGLLCQTSMLRNWFIAQFVVYSGIRVCRAFNRFQNKEILLITFVYFGNEHLVSWCWIRWYSALGISWIWVSHYQESFFAETSYRTISAYPYQGLGFDIVMLVSWNFFIVYVREMWRCLVVIYCLLNRSLCYKVTFYMF